MRENRTYGSEGGEGQLFPTPIPLGLLFVNGSLARFEMAGEDARPPRGHARCRIDFAFATKALAPSATFVLPNEIA